MLKHLPDITLLNVSDCEIASTFLKNRSGGADRGGSMWKVECSNPGCDRFESLKELVTVSLLDW